MMNAETGKNGFVLFNFVLFGISLDRVAVRGILQAAFEKFLNPSDGTDGLWSNFF